MILDKTSYTYDGKAKTPIVTVNLKGKTLVLNTDYTVSYSNNIGAGTAKVVVTGKGTFSGIVSVSRVISTSRVVSISGVVSVSRVIVFIIRIRFCFRNVIIMYGRL